MSENGKVYVDSLFVGLTRPPMLFGVGYMVVMLNLFIGMIGYIISEKFSFLLMIFPAHMFAYYLSSKEPLFLELFQIKMSRCNKCTNKLYYKANSYDPM